MARFTDDGEVHAERRKAMVELIDSFDPAEVANLAERRASARLRGKTVEAVSDVAYTVPTEALLDALGAGHDSTEHVRDVGLIVAAIGRGQPSDAFTDAAVERLSGRFVTHPCGPVAVLSMLYQNHDATAALLIETIDAAGHARTRRSAVTRTARIAVCSTRVADTDVAQGTTVTLDLAESGFEYGFGAHQCPGRALGEAIVHGIQTALAANRYVLVPERIERDPTGRPTVLEMEPRP